jgi:amidohydrolase
MKKSLKGLYSSNMDNISNQIEALRNYTIENRRFFHENPELGFSEKITSSFIADALTKMGVPFIGGVADTGIIATIEGQSKTPLILLRFDMDGLPIQEANNVPYKSKNNGKMHGCGHDGHMAIGLTSAQLLNRNKNTLNGTIQLFFQPAEECFGGAKKAIESGYFLNPKPDYALALHLWNEKPVGWIGLAEGPVMAGDDTFQITIHGKGGHGAIPNTSVDPIITVAHIISALQSIVSRNVPPLGSAVVSVTKVCAGETYNIIPETAVMEGTIRFFDEGIHQIVIKRFREIVEGICSSFACTCKIQIANLSTPVTNDEKVTYKLRKQITCQLPNFTWDSQFQTMGSEDMALILDRIPGCYIFIGSANHEKGLDFGHHNPRFDFDETALLNGVEVLLRSTYILLENPR